MQRPPAPRGLYDPAFEHDACGVSFVVDMAGRRSHRIVEQGLDCLCNLALDPATSGGGAA